MFDLIGKIKKKSGLDGGFADNLTVPKSVQDVIHIDSVYADGIITVGKDTFSKTYKFTDINYAVAAKEDKEANFLRYSEILNSLENNISNQITIINRKLKNDELKEMALLSSANDGKDKYRKEINEMLTMLANGANAIVQDKWDKNMNNPYIYSSRSSSSAYLPEKNLSAKNDDKLLIIVNLAELFQACRCFGLEKNNTRCAVSINFGSILCNSL